MPNCPRCRKLGRPDARFCFACGLSLAPGIDGTFNAGRVRCPHPLAGPEQMARVEGAADLYFRWESALDGPLLIGTEGARITIFNAGYGLCDGLLIVTGAGDGGTLFAIERSVPRLPQGASATVEVPSYELSAPLRTLAVRLLRAEFIEEV